MATTVPALVAQLNRLNTYLKYRGAFPANAQILSRDMADESLRIMQLITAGSGEPNALERYFEYVQLRSGDPTSYVSQNLDSIVASLAIYGDTFGLPKVPAAVAPPGRTADVPDFVKDYQKNNPIKLVWDAWMYASVAGIGLLGVVGAALAARKLARR